VSALPIGEHARCCRLLIAQLGAMSRPRYRDWRREACLAVAVNRLLRRASDLERSGYFRASDAKKCRDKAAEIEARLAV
jgi:hypothetical protein